MESDSKTGNNLTFPELWASLGLFLKLSKSAQSASSAPFLVGISGIF